MEYKEMGYESVLIFISIYFSCFCNLCSTFFMFFRKIVAEFEGTITQMMGKFHNYTLNGLGWGCVLSLRLLTEVSTLSLLMALIFQGLPG